jgi:hypothetical protein
VTLAHCKKRAEPTVLGLVMIPPESMNFSGSGRLEKSGDRFRPDEDDCPVTPQQWPHSPQKMILKGESMNCFPWNRRQS